MPMDDTTRHIWRTKRALEDSISKRSKIRLGFQGKDDCKDREGIMNSGPGLEIAGKKKAVTGNPNLAFCEIIGMGMDASASSAWPRNF